MITKDKNIEINKSSLDKSEIPIDDISKLIDTMILDQKILQNGYQILLNYEFRKNFYFNILIKDS